MTALSQSGFGGLPRNAPLDIVIDFVNRLMAGRLNAYIAVTLRANQTTTTLTDARLGPNSIIALMPLSANASTALASVWFSGQIKGSATINHASSANTDQNFRALIIG